MIICDCNNEKVTHLVGQVYMCNACANRYYQTHRKWGWLAGIFLVVTVIFVLWDFGNIAYGNMCTFTDGSFPCVFGVR